MIYRFSDDDFEVARKAAQYRHEQSDKKNCTNVAGLLEQDADKADMIGCLSELAFQRLLGAGPEPELLEGTFKAPDFIDRWGGKWHIRGTDHPTGSLIVRDRDKLDGLFALMVVDLSEQTARIAGWRKAKSIPRVGWWGTRSDRPECWWVAQRALFEIEDYLEDVRC